MGERYFGRNMTERYAVAMNANKEFFGLEETFSTTSPRLVKHPHLAKRITPYDPSEPLREAPYYFENSDRMRSWLQGFRMVWVETRIFSVIDQAGAEGSASSREGEP